MATRTWQSNEDVESYDSDYIGVGSNYIAELIKYIAAKVWDADSDVESVTTEDGNTKVGTDPGYLGEVALWQDVFGSVLDAAHWAEHIADTGYTESDSHSVSEAGGKLTISVTEASGTWSGWGVKSPLNFPGDFNRQIELDITETDQEYVVFRFFNDANNWAYIAKRKYGPTNQILAGTAVNGVLTSNTFNTTNATPKFKIIRAGTTLELWYDIGGGWVKLHEYTGAVSIGTLNLFIYIITRNGNTVSCDFDNLIANSGFPVWEDSPEIILNQWDLGSSKTIDMSLFSDSTVGAGSVKYKYATNAAGDDWNGAWLTMAELQAQSDPETQYFKLKAQLISDGTQAIKLNSVSYPDQYGTESVVTLCQQGGTRALFDMSTFAETKAGAATVKYKYATNQAGDSWNGAWLTEGEMQAQSDVTSKYFKLKVQFTGDGSQTVKLTDCEIDYTVIERTVKKYEIEKTFVPENEELAKVYQEICEKVKNHITFEATLTAGDVSNGYIEVDPNDLEMKINISDIAYIHTSMEDISESEVLSIGDTGNANFSYGTVKANRIRVSFGAVFDVGDKCSAEITLKQNA